MAQHGPPLLTVLLVAMSLLALSHGYPKAKLKTPPMGWNSYNYFHCSINETLIREIADALVSTGLSRVGYKFVNLDDCWNSAKRWKGQLQPDRKAFPSGIKNLANYVHGKGLKLGIYGSSGKKTCLERAGSAGFETVDARTFAFWGVDYVKYDNCFVGMGLLFPKERFTTMGKAIQATNRNMIYSVCEWGIGAPAKWAGPEAHAHLWRTTRDIMNNWGSMMRTATVNNKWAKFAGPGKGWNDPDMLQVGNGVLTPGEDRVHFTIWCIAKAPLILGNDVRRMSAQTLKILENTEAIYVNQDPLGVQGEKVMDEDDFEVWAGPLSGRRHAVALVNIGLAPLHIKFNLVDDLGLTWANQAYTVRDIWKAQTQVNYSPEVKRLVAGHDVAFLVITPGVRITQARAQKARAPLAKAQKAKGRA